MTKGYYVIKRSTFVTIAIVIAVLTAVNALVYGISDTAVDYTVGVVTMFTYLFLRAALETNRLKRRLALALAIETVRGVKG